MEIIKFKRPPRRSFSFRRISKMFFELNPFVENKKYFDSQLQEFVYYSKYARWRDDLGRRETWSETVERVVDYLKELSGGRLEEGDYQRIHNAILNMDVMPSMRLMAMAGKAARAHPISCYNCAALGINSIEAIVEVMYLSMNGVGVGFSVEKQFVDLLPKVKQQGSRKKETFVIPDSTEGWCDAFATGLLHWFDGSDIVFDYSRIRPAGTVLRTKGGTASGPQPLKELLDFSRELILEKQGRKLQPIDVYDIVTRIADCVISGGVRRSASLCLFDYDDHAMRNAKNGQYGKEKPWRANANNSVVIERRLNKEEMDALFDAIHDGYNGEPGIFSRYAVRNNLPVRRSKEDVYLTNACGESVLSYAQDGGGLCNLSSVVARRNDTFSDLWEKAEVASLIGTIQSMATDFKYLRPGWKRIAEEQRLLGVDITGHYDCEIVRDRFVLEVLQSVVVRVNKEYAKKLGINQSVATTLVKPSGNSGLLLDVSSGVHPRWSKFYIRNMRVNQESPLFRTLQDSGVEMTHERDKTWVVGFPVASPRGAITRHELSALEHLEYWKLVKTAYAEHSVSCTVYYAESEIDDVKAWLYENQDALTGVSLLPRSDFKYNLAPYVEITEEEYSVLSQRFPDIDFSQLQHYEQYDQTESTKVLACVSGGCETI